MTEKERIERKKTMGYIYITIAAIGIAANFLLQKLYQKKYCKTAKSFVFLPLLLGVINFVYYFVVNGFKIDFTAFSFVMAFLYALTTTYNTIIGLIIMKYCPMSLFSMFIMMGGMFIPFLYGILLSPQPESITVYKIIGLVLLTCALALISVQKGAEKPSKKGLLLCLSVFIVNGFVSTISKAHQIYGELGIYTALPSANFMIYVTVFSFMFSCVIYAIVSRRTKEKIQEKSELTKSSLVWQILLILSMVIVSCTATIFNLRGQKTVDASVIFPMTSGGSIVLMTVFGAVFYKEKLNLKVIIGVVFAVVATVLFAI